MFEHLKNILNNQRNNQRNKGVLGKPQSGNGASSFHLYWKCPNVAYLQVNATITVTNPPTVPKLYFWALQVNFESDNRKQGGAHFGLQHHSQYQNNGAINWGGYFDLGGELEGTTSNLKSDLNNVNTRNYQWQSNIAYEYKIQKTSDGNWLGSITNLETGEQTHVRELFCDAEYITNPMVWTECFANHDDPSTTVAWSNLKAISTDGKEHKITSAEINYQKISDGGSANTNSYIHQSSFIQQTNTQRTNLSQTSISIPENVDNL